MKAVKRDYEDIFTVIITNDADEPTTVSFVEYDDAVDYIISELDEGGAIRSPEDEADIRRELEYQNFYDEGRCKIYIEEARLF